MTARSKTMTTMMTRRTRRRICTRKSTSRLRPLSRSSTLRLLSRSPVIRGTLRTPSTCLPPRPSLLLIPFPPLLSPPLLSSPLGFLLMLTRPSSLRLTLLTLRFCCLLPSKPVPRCSPHTYPASRPRAPEERGYVYDQRGGREIGGGRVPATFASQCDPPTPLGKGMLPPALLASGSCGGLSVYTYASPCVRSGSPALETPKNSKISM